MKICIIYATAGAGHRKAAEALYSAFKSTQHSAVLADSLDYTSSFYKRLYSGSYTFMITYVPWLWGFFFSLIDIPFLLPIVRCLRRITNTINGGRLAKYFVEEQFDYVFSTHFFPTEVSAYLKRKKKINSTIVTCITDYDVHSIWLAEGMDIYVVATDWTKKKLQSLGVTEEKIRVYGIPTDKKFTSHTDIAGLKQKLGLKEGVFTVLMATGSFGIGPIEEIISFLEGFQVIVVCGHNKALYRRLSQKQKELVKVCGLVDNMDELMAVSDAMITKPGGLSTSEALVSNLALIFFSAIPGQEAGNIKVLKEYGLGISGISIKDMAEILNRYRVSPDELRKVQERTKSIARPRAVDDITALVQ